MRPRRVHHDFKPQGSATPPSSPQQTSTPDPSGPISSTGSHGTATSVETPFTLQIDGETVTGTLFGNAASHSLIEQFPLTLTFRDHGGQEKLARLPKPLPLDDVPAGDDADPLTIGYYAPDQVLVLYYEHVGYFNGIVRIGTFDDLSAVRDPTGPLTATINLA